MKALLTFAIAAAVSAVAFAAEGGKEIERLQKSAEVINEVMGTPERRIPKVLLDKAVCLGVVPSQKKLALGFGGSYGRGCLVCRRGGTGAWGAPWMFMITGPSIGFQIGGQATDFVLAVMNAKGAQSLVKGKTKLGADASVARRPCRTDGGRRHRRLDASRNPHLLTLARRLRGVVTRRPGD